MRLNRVTITGWDESVKPYDLCAMHGDFPFVEFGILMSATKEGTGPRYPSRGWIDYTLARTVGLPLAAHLCGEWSRDAVEGPFLWAIERHEMFERFQRFQFNGASYAIPIRGRLRRFAGSFLGKEFILQVQSFASSDGTGHDVGKGSPSMLLDRSGGRGIVLDEFPLPVPGVRCGYSGGFGPDNLEAMLTKLTALPSDASFWVDLETNVRSDRDGRSVLDLDKVRRCLEIAAPFVKAGTS